LAVAGVHKEVKAGKVQRMTGDVLVVGSTYAALDAARTAIRLGCSSCGLVHDRAKDQLPFDPAEIQAAEEEGVQFHALLKPVAVLRADGKVTGLKCVACEAQDPDKTGRARTAAKPGTETDLLTQIVLMGGALEPDLTALQSKGGANREIGVPRVACNPWNLIAMDPVSLATNVPGVFAAGDATTGGASVIEAVAAGQRAAIGIHRSLRGLAQKEPFRLFKPRRRVDSSEAGEGIENFKRPQEALRPASERAHDFREADTTFSEMLAVCEAKRCLHCDLD